MSHSQLRRDSGKNCRNRLATIAGAAKPHQSAIDVFYQKRRLPLFAQFPPAALFAAIGRAAKRNSPQRQPASGTALAISRLWHANGGPK